MSQIQHKNSINKYSYFYVRGDVMNINILIVISCICMLFVIGKIFILPIKKILKLVFNSVFGGILIWIINFIGGIWGFHIGLNIYTSILVRNFRYTRSCFSCFYKINIRRINFAPLGPGIFGEVFHTSPKIPGPKGAKCSKNKKVNL